MTNLTVVIFTPIDDVNIKECVESAKLLTENIILIHPTSSFVETIRETGIKQAKTDWILILDADERLTKDLSKEIKSIIRNPQYTNYMISRKNIFAKTKWLRYGGWWPDYQIRLINKKHFVNWPKRIHSTPIIKGSTGNLSFPILHYFHGDLNKMVEKTIIFEDIESNLLFKANRTSGTLIFFRKFLAELWRRLFKGLGFFDGTLGVIESVYQAFSKTFTYLLLYEKNKSRTL